jgi:hypothetical protein
VVSRNFRCNSLLLRMSLSLLCFFLTAEITVQCCQIRASLHCPLGKNHGHLEPFTATKFYSHISLLKILEFRFELSAEEKTTWNFVPWNKIEGNSLDSFPNPSAEENQLGIPFRGTKIEANSWNSLTHPSAEEKTIRNSVPWNKNRSKFSEFRSEPFRGRENNS